MLEVPASGEDHRDLVLVTSCNNLVVAFRPTRLNDRCDAGLRGFVDRVRKWEKSFKEGSLVRVRVFGFRLMEGLATGVLKVALAFLLLCILSHMNCYVNAHGPCIVA